MQHSVLKSASEECKNNPGLVNLTVHLKLALALVLWAQSLGSRAEQLLSQKYLPHLLYAQTQNKRVATNEANF